MDVERCENDGVATGWRERVVFRERCRGGEVLDDSRQKKRDGGSGSRGWILPRLAPEACVRHK